MMSMYTAMATFHVEDLRCGLASNMSAAENGLETLKQIAACITET